MQATPDVSADDGPVAPGIERLDEDQCWSLLQQNELGRLAVRADEGVDVFPVNYASVHRRLVIRSAHGTKLNALTVHPEVAFEIDGSVAGVLWSVVVKGRARTPELATELQQLHDRRLPSFSPQAKSVYVVIEPVSVTGRRFVKRLEFDAD
jgi:nitroimidazol reductase NimA-like FMN-containing flavoprotein (pyridoxamine 5'-phosphate oxidase superfamily)